MLARGLQKLNIPVTDILLQQLHDYISLLIKWNKIYNLTSITEPKEIIVRHILDSLSIVTYILGDRVLDVGSGAGFPGAPLALVLPEKQFVLLDSSIKRIRFLTCLKAKLKMTNVEIAHSRVENYHPATKFTCIVTRAFASIPEMIKMTEHLYQQDSVLLAMKGRVPRHGLEGLKNVIVRCLQVPLLDDGERHLICVKGISSDQNNSSN